MPAAYADLHDDATRLLEDRQPTAIATPGLREEFLAHLRAHPDAMWRHGPPAHFTASTIVFDEDLRHTLLVLHRKARLWLQVGGHLEPEDGSVAAAALREAREESGIEGLRPLHGLAALHRHELAAAFGRCRAHLDLRFVAIAPAGSEPVVSDESEAVRWWPVDELPADTDPDLPALIRGLRDLVATSGTAVG